MMVRRLHVVQFNTKVPGPPGPRIKGCARCFVRFLFTWAPRDPQWDAQPFPTPDAAPLAQVA